MQNKLQTHLLPFIFYLLWTYFAYYLLIYGKRLHTSIGQIIVMSHNLSLKPHILVLGALPIYISVMIFGGGLIGLYLGGLAQQLLINKSSHLFRNRH